MAAAAVQALRADQSWCACPPDVPWPVLAEDAAGHVVAVNAALTQWLGCKPEDLLGRPLNGWLRLQRLCATGADDAQQGPRGLAPATESADNWQALRLLARLHPHQGVGECTWSDAHGQARWVRASLRAASPAAPEGCWWWYLQDITSERQAHARSLGLQQERDHWFEQSALGKAVLDDTGLVLRTNPVFDEWLGGALISLSDAPSWMRPLLGGGETQGCWHPALRPDGPALEAWADTPGMPGARARQLRSRVRRVTFADGHVRVLVELSDGAAKLQQTQEQVALAQELTAILDSAPVGMAYLRDRRLVRCNLRFERLLGFAPGEAAGLTPEALFEVCGMGSLGATDVAQSLAAGRSCDVEMAMAPVARPGAADPTRERAGGAASWFAVSLRPVEGSGQDAVLALTDISRLKQQQVEIERALVENELMFHQSEVGIVWLRGGRIRRANAAICQLTGLSAAGLVGRTLAGLQPPGDASLAESMLRDQLRREGRCVGEHRLCDTDGRERWVHVLVRSVAPQDPTADLICSVVDVDDRQRAREALQQQALRTRSVLDSVLVGIVTVGEAGIAWMNRSARRMFGGDLGDFLGAPIGCVATEEPDHPLRRDDWLARLADGESESFECRLQARDGRTFWVVGNAVAMRSEGDATRQVTFALLDIEARRQAEVRVHRARASLQRLIETAPLAIALFDAASLQMCECNLGAASYFGRPVEQLMGGTPEHCLRDGAAAAALRASLALARDTGEPVRREVERDGVAGQGRSLWDARFVCVGEPDAQGPVKAGQILLVASDVTDQRRAEQRRLEAAIAQRELLVKEVHHRIKNNLQGVAGLLQQSAQRQPAIAEPLMEAIGQVQAIAQVYGLQVGAAAPLDLAGVLSAVAGTVQRSRHHMIDVIVDPRQSGAWRLPEPESIPLALSLNELLVNAVQHGNGQPVRCHLQAHGDGVAIELINGGRLPDGFEFARIAPGMAGLGLVRALLPRRAASLSITQQGDDVVARLEIRPPSVQAVALRHNAAIAV